VRVEVVPVPATPSRRIALGQWGEQKAVEHLVEQGMEIVDRNWRCPLGELDIVAYDGRTLVMIEVKTRTSEAFGSPAEAVTPRKAARLRQLAAQWLRERGDRPLEVRIDVIGVLVPERGAWRLDHLKAVA
jgi:putative endonuclease